VDVDGQRQLLDERAVAHLRAANTLLRLLPLRDVDRKPLTEGRPALGRLDEHRLILDPDDPAVRRDHPVLDS
jgi:hypothetical protein